MPDKAVTQKARKDLNEGKSTSTAAGEFVHQEIEHVRQGKHGARSPQQAIAIGLSEARRAGIPVKPPATGKTSATTRRKAQNDSAAGKSAPKSGESSSARSRATTKALKREPKNTASRAALSSHAKSAAKKRVTAAG